MTKRTAEIENAILDGLANGVSLAALCRRHDITRAAFYNWMQKDPDLAERYAQAETVHADALIDRCIEIADDARKDWIERRDKPGIAFDYEHVRRVKLRIETRFKAAARIERKRLRKLGIDPTAAQTGPIDVAALLTQVRARLDGSNG